MKINIHSPIGDPTNQRTWSGTPFHIVNQFKKAGCLGEIFYPGAYKFRQKIGYKLLYKLYSKNVLEGVGGLIGWSRLRTYTASVLAKQQQQFEWKDTLHLGTLGLPFLKQPHNHRQYLYTDGVWSLWSKYSPDAQKLSVAQHNKIDKLERSAYSQINHFFSISACVKAELIGNYGISPDKISVVATGSGTIRPFLGVKDYTNGKILFVAKGRFEDKGGQIVLAAFQKALSVNPGLHLTIVGQNDYTHLISHPQITTLGFVTTEKLQEIFESHSLFFMPALNEPWGLVYIEAMLCKMPILGLNRNSFPELSGYGKYGKGLDEPNPELFAQAICHFFSAPKEMQRIGEEAQQHAMQQFTWEGATAKMISKIRQMSQE